MVVIGRKTERINSKKKTSIVQIATAETAMERPKENDDDNKKNIMMIKIGIDYNDNNDNNNGNGDNNDSEDNDGTTNGKE